MNKISVLIIDNHTGFKRSLTHFLISTGNFEVVGEVSCGSEGLALARTLQPQVILIEERMSGANGSNIIGKMKKALPDVIIVVLTLWNAPEYLQMALENRKVDGYVIKENLLTDLLPTLDQLIPPC
jgi:two-component system nitrate/nitrite response regulator NarL